MLDINSRLNWVLVACLGFEFAQFEYIITYTFQLWAKRMSRNSLLNRVSLKPNTGIQKTYKHQSIYESNSSFNTASKTNRSTDNIYYNDLVSYNKYLINESIDDIQKLHRDLFNEDVDVNQQLVRSTSNITHYSKFPKRLLPILSSKMSYSSWKKISNPYKNK